MVVVMAGDEVTAIVTMAGAVVGRWGGEVTIVRQVIGRRAGANPYREGQAMKWMLVVLVGGVTPVNTDGIRQVQRVSGRRRANAPALY